MKEQLKKKHSELREKMKKHDEAILKLIKKGHKEIVIRILTDYLSSLE